MFKQTFIRKLVKQVKLKFELEIISPWSNTLGHSLVQSTEEESSYLQDTTYWLGTVLMPEDLAVATAQGSYLCATLAP